MISTNFNNAVRTAFVVKSVAPDGISTEKLNPFQFGIVDANTWKTASGPFLKNKKVHFVVGSPNTGQNVGGLRTERLMNVNNSNISFKSEQIFGHNIEKVILHKPQKDIKPFEGYFGYNGMHTCKSIDFPCGQDLQFVVHIEGRLVRSIYGKNIEKRFDVTTECCDNCADECNTAPKYQSYLNDLVARMNADETTGRFATFESVIHCDTPLTPPEKTLFTTYCLTVCDNGDELALADVQAQYSQVVTVKERKAPYTTYEVTVPNTSAVPTAYTQNSIVLKGCADCPAGFTANAAGKLYLIQAEIGISVKTNDVTSLADVTSIPEFATAISAKWISYDEGSTKYLVLMPLAFNETSVVSDNVKVDQFLGIQEATCTSGSTTTSWVACDECYKIVRSLCLTIKKSDCNATVPDLDKVIAASNSYPDIVVGSLVSDQTNNCLTTYRIDQYSNCLKDGCDTYGSDGAKFVSLPPYEGQMWSVCPCDGWTVNSNGCPVPPVQDDNCCQYGIKVTTKTDVYRPEGCEFDLDDNYRLSTLSVNIEQVFDITEAPKCSWISPGFLITQTGTVDNLSGQSVFRDVLQYRMYREEGYFPQDRMNRLMQKAEGLKYGVVLSDYYYALVVKHRVAHDHIGNTAWLPTEEIVLYVHENDLDTLAALKTLIYQYTTSNGVYCEFDV